MIEGSSAPPTFVRNLILGLSEEPTIQLAVLGKSSARRVLPNVKVIASDYDRLASLIIVVKLVKEAILRPKLLLEAKRLTTPARGLKEWIKRWYRTVQILKYNPQILHFQWAAHIEAYQRLIAARRYKCLISLRGTQISVHPVVNPETDALYREVFPYCHFHAVSEAMKNKALQYAVPSDRVKVIYSPVPKTFFDAYDDNYPIERKPLRVLSLGRFHWIKGYPYAIEAIRLLIERGIDVQYTIVAQGKPPGEILFQISDRDLESHVKILGGVPYSHVIALMKDSHLLLLSSVEEGLANVVVEAMALGLPVISTECGGMGEIVIQGETGWLVPARNPEAMADELEKFIHLPPGQLLAIRRNAYAMVKSKFQSDDNIRAFCAWYREVANEG